MSARRPSRIALAIFDRCIPDNDPLRGNLLERFHAGASQWWLWRQVLYAAVARPGQQRLPPLLKAQLVVLGAAMLVLTTFEAVFVTGVMDRLLFGTPPVLDITGYWYIFPTPFHAVASTTAQPWQFAVPVVVVLGSFPTGWWLARLHERHRVVSIVAFSIGITACAAMTLGLPFELRFLTTLGFIIGLLVAGTTEVATSATRDIA